MRSGCTLAAPVTENGLDETVTQSFAYGLSMSGEGEDREVKRTESPPTRGREWDTPRVSATDWRPNRLFIGDVISPNAHDGRGPVECRNGEAAFDARDHHEVSRCTNLA